MMGWSSSATLAVLVGAVLLSSAIPTTQGFAGSVGRVAVKDEKSAPKKPKKKAKNPKKKKSQEEAAPVRKGIDVTETWRGENQVFTPGQLEKLEPILASSTCRDEKAGCTYQDNGKPGSEASFAFRLIPWKVSGHRGYLVRNDRCGAGGCDEGLFVLIDGQWRLLIEAFGILERARTSTHGFNDLTFRPRGQAPVRLVWDGRAYREEN